MTVCWRRMLRKRLLQLSAAEFVSIGLGDDQSGFGYLGGLDPWMSQLLGALYPSASMTGQPQLGPEEYIVSVSSSEEEIDSVIETQPAFGQFQGIYGTHLVGPFTATVVSNERLTDPVWPQTVCNIRLRAEAEYNCGDVAVVHPRIPAPLVARALKATGIRASSVCSIRRVGRFGGTRRGRIGSVVSTAEGLFTHFLDIAGIPQRSYFELLSFFATDAEEKEKLIELSSGAGTDLYFDYCFREKRNFVDVLEDFASCRCQVPLQRLLEVIPTLKPREYSIASAPSEFLGQVISTTSLYL